MLEEALQGLSAALAVVGAAALGVRFLRSALRVLLQAADVTAAESMAEISARRGDLTTLAERRADERQARQGRRRDGVVALLWLLWLLVPAAAGWASIAYALAAPVWLLPSRPLRSAPQGPATGNG